MEVVEEVEDEATQMSSEEDPSSPPLVVGEFYGNHCLQLNLVVSLRKPPSR